MGIFDRIKRVTPKQWVMLAAGGGGIALLANYVYAKDDSIVSKLWRSVKGGGYDGPLPPPGAMHAHSAPMQLPMSAVFVEPTQAEPMPPEVWAPMYGGVPHFAHFYSPLGHHHHVTGGAGELHATGAPKKWDGIKSNVPPPGSRGIVSVTPPAPTDPGQPQDGSQQASCGPGLYFDMATGTCLPYPTTPPYGG